MRVHISCILAAGLLLGTRVALADPITDQNYGAHVHLVTTIGNGANLQESWLSGQTSAGGNLASTDAIAVGTAAFNGVPLLSADVNTFTSASGANVEASLVDTLTFRVAGGGSADVYAQMSGNWAATAGTGTVNYILYLETIAYTGGFAGGTDGTGGAYTGGGVWPVTDGRSYRIYAKIEVGAAYSGGSAHMDDPLTFAIPDGVTFTAASGNTYSAGAPVPEPETCTMLLAGLGLIGWVGRRRSDRKFDFRG